MRKGILLLLILLGGSLGYCAALVRHKDAISTFPKYYLSGEFKATSVPGPLDTPGFYTKGGVLENGLDSPVYVASIYDDGGQRARITQLATAQKVKQYYAPGNLILDLGKVSGRIESALLLSGDGIQFSFDEIPVGSLHVDYVELGKGPEQEKELVVDLKIINP